MSSSLSRTQSSGSRERMMTMDWQSLDPQMLRQLCWKSLGGSAIAGRRPPMSGPPSWYCLGKMISFHGQRKTALSRNVAMGSRCVLPKQTSVCDLDSSPSLDVATHGLLVKMACKKNAIFKIKIAFFLCLSCWQWRSCRRDFMWFKVKGWRCLSPLGNSCG